MTSSKNISTKKCRLYKFCLHLCKWESSLIYFVYCFSFLRLLIELHLDFWKVWPQMISIVRQVCLKTYLHIEKKVKIGWCQKILLCDCWYRLFLQKLQYMLTNIQMNFSFSSHGWKSETSRKLHRISLRNIKR